MSMQGSAELLRLLDEVQRIQRAQTLRVTSAAVAGAPVSAAAVGAAGDAPEPAFDAIRLQSLIFEESHRIRNLLLDALGGRGPARPDPPPPEEWTDADVLRLLDQAQGVLLRHPVAAQAGFAALVAEGRRFAGTPEGARWAAVLAGSELMQRARWVWETTSLNLLEEDPDTLVPSTYLEALLRASETPDLEAVLSRVQGMGHE